MTAKDTSVADGDLDLERVEAFVERMVGVLNGASLALLTSVGHQVGLFDTMATLPPSTSAQIADAAGCSERYVREWLAGMTTGGVVEYDPAASAYRLPPEHAAVLTRAAGPDDLAHITQFVTMMARVEEPIVECFRSGGGVPYTAFADFHRIMAEDSATIHDAALVDTILPLVPGLPDRLRAGIDVADVGCGSGHAVNLMAQAFPASRFVGFDISEEGIAAAVREATELGLTNAEFVVQDVADLAETERFDLITTFDAIHDQAQPAQVLANIADALRPDGTYLMVDIRASSNLEDNLEHPLGTFGYTISTMHCMTVSLAADGAGLGTFWGEQVAQQMLADAGFTNVDVTNIDSDVANTYFIATKS